MGNVALESTHGIDTEKPGPYYNWNKGDQCLYRKHKLSSWKQGEVVRSINHQLQIQIRLEGGRLVNVAFDSSKLVRIQTPVEINEFITPLHRAAWCGDFPATIEYLQNYPHRIMYGDSNGNTAAHFAVLADQLDIVTFLVNLFPAFLRSTNKRFQTLLSLAKPSSRCITFLQQKEEEMCTFIVQLLNDNNRTKVDFLEEDGSWIQTKAVSAQQHAENKTWIHIVVDGYSGKKETHVGRIAPKGMMTELYDMNICKFGGNAVRAMKEWTSCELKFINDLGEEEWFFERIVGTKRSKEGFVCFAFQSSRKWIPVGDLQNGECAAKAAGNVERYHQQKDFQFFSRVFRQIRENFRPNFDHIEYALWHTPVKTIARFQHPEYDNFTLLHMATELKWKEVCWFLVRRKGPMLLTIPDRYGRVPIHLAVKQNNRELVSFFANAAPSTIFIQDLCGDSPFGLASKLRNTTLPVLEYLYRENKNYVSVIRPGDYCDLKISDEWVRAKCTDWQKDQNMLAFTSERGVHYVQTFEPERLAKPGFYTF